MNKFMNIVEFELCMEFDLNKDQNMIDLLDGKNNTKRLCNSNRI